MDLKECKDVVGKVHPITCHEGTEREKRYSCTLSLISALDGKGWLTPSPGALVPGMTGYPLHSRLGRPRGRSGRVRKMSPPLPGFDCRTVQALASRYTDYATPAHRLVGTHAIQGK
jgi:hypothetical protein